MKGDIKISVGSVNLTFPIDDNTDTMVNAPVPAALLVGLFGAMDNASNMQVSVGEAALISISLVGSTKVTNAFRTCAGLPGAATSPGSNPFE